MKPSRNWKRALGISLLVLLAILLIGPFLVPVPPLEGTLPPQQLADADGQFVDVNDITVHFKETGQGRTAILLLHGFGASLFSWREVIEPLGAYGRVIAYDRPAFGLTERPMPGEWRGASPYGPQANVELLIGLMDVLGIQQAVLVGNSAGGTVAVQAALDHPDRVRALVLVDPSIYGGGRYPSWLLPLLRTPQMRHIGPLLVREISVTGNDIILSAWHDPARISPDVIEGYRLPLRVDNWDRALYEFSIAGGQQDLSVRLTELTMPVLVVTGDDDRLVPAEQSIRLAGEIPGAQLVVFEACGHVPQEECPQAWLEAVTAFLQALE